MHPPFQMSGSTHEPIRSNYCNNCSFWFLFQCSIDVTSVVSDVPSSSNLEMAIPYVPVISDTTTCVSSSADILTDILVLPESESQRPKHKTKPALNSKAVCVTSSSVLEQLQREKEEREALVTEQRKLEREAKKIEASHLRESKKKEKRADPEE